MKCHQKRLKSTNFLYKCIDDGQLNDSSAFPYGRWALSTSDQELVNLTPNWSFSWSMARTLKGEPYQFAGGQWFCPSGCLIMESTWKGNWAFLDHSKLPVTMTLVVSAIQKYNYLTYFICTRHSVCFISYFISYFIKICVDFIFCVQEFTPFFCLDNFYKAK